MSINKKKDDTKYLQTKNNFLKFLNKTLLNSSERREVCHVKFVYLEKML